MGYHFQTPPLMTGAPVVPLPDPDENPEWFGDFNIQYPLSETLFTTSHGHLFKAWSDLRAIANDLGLAIYSGHGPAAIHANKYLEFHEQLDKWFSSLPVVLQPRNIVWPSQFNLQYVYTSLRQSSWTFATTCQERYITTTAMLQRWVNLTVAIVWNTM